jgi:Calcineurin-like phosphoesterase
VYLWRSKASQITIHASRLRIIKLNPYRIIFFLLAFSVRLMASTDPKPQSPDASTAGVDGPFVFYRESKVVVKQITEVDQQLLFTNKVFDNKNGLRLSCKSDATADQFSFDILGKFAPEQEVYAQPEKMLVISDIEGNFLTFKMLLLGAGVLDKDFNWTFGKGHLVLLGDFMDRGLDVNAVLWLAYKMDQEAKLKGGKVHFILGNHEVMNLTGDTRYVRNKYFENARIIKENYKNWYKMDTEIGRWLRSKNAVERIGDRIFCHAGISPQMAYSGLTLTDVNEKTRYEISGTGTVASERSASVAVSESYGPYWYRGLVRNEVKEHEMKAIMGWCQASQIVIGHTLVNEITYMYGGRVIAMDLMHEVNALEGKAEALWIDKNGTFIINHEGKKRVLSEVIQRP